MPDFSQEELTLVKPYVDRWKQRVFPTKKPAVSDYSKLGTLHVSPASKASDYEYIKIKQTYLSLPTEDLAHPRRYFHCSRLTFYPNYEQKNNVTELILDPTHPPTITEAEKVEMVKFLLDSRHKALSSDKIPLIEAMKFDKRFEHACFMHQRYIQDYYAAREMYCCDLFSRPQLVMRDICLNLEILRREIANVLVAHKLHEQGICKQGYEIKLSVEDIETYQHMLSVIKDQYYDYHLLWVKSLPSAHQSIHGNEHLKQIKVVTEDELKAHFHIHRDKQFKEQGAPNLEEDLAALKLELLSPFEPRPFPEPYEVMSMEEEELTSSTKKACHIL